MHTTAFAHITTRFWTNIFELPEYSTAEDESHEKTRYAELSGVLHISITLRIMNGKNFSKGIDVP
jgi:hypothetical protein